MIRSRATIVVLVALAVVLAIGFTPALGSPGKGNGNSSNAGAGTQGAPSGSSPGKGKPGGTSSETSDEGKPATTPSVESTSEGVSGGGKNSKAPSGKGSSNSKAPSGKGSSNSKAPSGKGSSKAKGKADGTSSGVSSGSKGGSSTSASQSGKPVHGCEQANAGHTHAYASTCDGSPSQNGNGGGKATGKPCAGCVGAADNKNPKGQFPNGSDHNNGYECDGNKGVGKGNPAHTGCKTSPPPCVGPNCDPPPPPCVGPNCNPPPPPCVGPNCNPPPPPCDADPNMPGIQPCLEQPSEPEEPEVASTFIERLSRRAPSVQGSLLPFTGASSLLLWAAISFGLVGTGSMLSKRRK